MDQSITTVPVIHESVAVFFHNFQSDLDQKKAILGDSSLLLKQSLLRLANKEDSTRKNLFEEPHLDEKANHQEMMEDEETHRICLSFEALLQDLENHIQFFPLPAIRNFFRISVREVDDEDESRTSESNSSRKHLKNSFQYESRELNERSKKIKKRKKIPKSALEVLKAWFEANIYDPYPTNDIKHELAKKANIDFKQVHNWFINARGRTSKSAMKVVKFGNLVEKTYVEKKMKVNSSFLSE